jgi:hypothetical protein
VKRLVLICGVLLMSLAVTGCTVKAENDPLQTVEPEQVFPLTAVPPPTPLASSNTLSSANADVLFVTATETAVGLWTFAVEVSHPDTGWEDYADGWDVVLPNGTVAKVSPDDPFTRLLLHPHETEQPFTRSQSNIPIPADVTTVTVRAHDLVAGFGGQEMMVDLTAVSGPNFEVNRRN